MVMRNEVVTSPGRALRPTVNGAYTCACLSAAAVLLVAGQWVLATIVLLGVALRLALADSQR